MRHLVLMVGIIFKWYIWLKCILKQCQYIGCDAAGNQYYQEILKASSRQPRRWVLYHGLPEATKVSAEWANWMRHISATPPTGDHSLKYSWQQAHLPNLTGTKKAYKYSKRSTEKSQSKYRPWNPH